MNELKIKGTQSFMGKEIPVIEGGFGEAKRCLTDKTIGEIHNVKIKHVRESINNNIKRFKENIDFIDLKEVDDIDHNLDLLQFLGYSKMQISKSGHIYLLSERGYAKLIKIMDTDLAWEIHDKLIDEYFTMRKIINSDEQLKAKLLLDIYNGGQEGVVASKQLAELEKKPLLEKIEKDKPKVNYFDDFMNSNGLYTSTQVAKLFKFKSAQQFNKTLNENRIIFKQGRCWLPYSEVDKTWFKIIVGEKEGHNYSNLKITPKGIIALSKILKIEINKTDLQQLA